MMRDRRIQKARKGGIVVVLLAVWLFLGNLTVCAAESDSVAICRQELLEMMRNIDSSYHDVSQLKLKVTEINEIWWDLIEKEGYVDYSSYDLIYVTYKMSNGYVTHMALVGLDNEYPLRYASIQNHIAIVQEATKDMSDLEKVLFVNEYVDSITYYTYVSDHVKYRACGPLYKGYGVCEGYTEAVRLLLRQIGVPVTSVSSATINHGWNLVQIDGEWYHLDSTWDDAKGQGGTDTKHVYFLRNDNEYENVLPNKHYNWIVAKMDVKSTSTKYTDWFVHSIRGKMHYYDGLWYYIDNKTGDIVCSKVDVEQSDYEILIDKDEGNISNLAITKVEDNVLYYTADGVDCEITLQEKSSDLEIEDSGQVLDLSDVSYWKSGHYNMLKGEYQEYSGRICVTDYIPIEAGQSYQVHITDENYRILIRELNEQKEYIATWNLGNGRTFFTSDSTRYLGISLYSETEKPTYAEYCELFANGMQVRFSQATLTDVNETTSWNSEQYWRSGCYLLNTGNYSMYHSRVCLLDYLAVEGNTKYKAKISNNNYQMLIRELAQDKSFIKSYNLKNEDEIKLSSNTAYLAISLYNPSTESISYGTYLNAFNAGMQVGIEEIAELEKEETVDVNSTLLWNQVDFWKKGQYSMSSGIYEEFMRTRVCLLDYVSIDNANAYEIVVPDSNYHMLIREMSASKGFLASHNLAGGDIFVPSEETAYLAISLYMPSNDANATYNDYIDVIQAGVGLRVTDAVEEISALNQEDENFEEVTEESTEEITEEEATEESTEEITEEEATEESTEETAEEESTEESKEESTEEEKIEESTEETVEEETTEEPEETSSIEVEEIEVIIETIVQKESEEEETEEEEIAE